MFSIFFFSFFCHITKLLYKYNINHKYVCNDILCARVLVGCDQYAGSWEQPRRNSQKWQPPSVGRWRYRGRLPGHFVSLSFLFFRYRFENRASNLIPIWKLPIIGVMTKPLITQYGMYCMPKLQMLS